jgi:acyl dehydratase
VTLYAEDFAVGDEFALGSYTITKDGIVEFAREFDPQPFHVDEDAAGESMFGGLVASGWHVVSLTNRLMTDALFSRMALRGGHGTDEVRFLEPVRPGDTLTGVVEVVEISDPESRLQHRDVSLAVTTRKGETTVLTMVNHAMVARRATEA